MLIEYVVCYMDEKLLRVKISQSSFNYLVPLISALECSLRPKIPKRKQRNVTCFISNLSHELKSIMEYVLLSITIICAHVQQEQ